MTFPSGTLLAQSALSGIFIGSLYGLLGLGLGLAWGLLHVINLAHFGFAFLAAYLCYQLASVGGMDPLLTLVLIVPLFAVLGIAVQWLLARFAVSPLISLLATFGLTAIIEAGIQGVWTADFRKLESVYTGLSSASARCSCRCPELVTLLLARRAVVRHLGGAALSRSGRALRALAEDAPIAAAFGVNARAHALCCRGRVRPRSRASPACASRLGFTLTPAQIYAWVGVVFAAVMLGGLGRRSGRWPPASSSASAKRDDGVRVAVVGADRVVHAADPLLLLRPGEPEPRSHACAIAAAGLRSRPCRAGLPAFYESFLYLVFHWIVLATSWNMLSGYSGYFSFGHGAFYGAGVYTTAVLAGKFDVPFLWTLPAAARCAAAAGRGAGRRRVPRAQRARRAVRAADARGHLRARDDRAQHADRRRPGVYLSAVPVPRLAPTPSGSFYCCARARDVHGCVSYHRRSARLGLALFAIHDDEDAAEVMGVPTYRYKLARVRDLVRARRVAGGIHALFIRVRARRTARSTSPSPLHRRADERAGRHAPLGRPALGATAITLLALRIDGGRAGGRRQGGDRRDPRRGRAVHARGILGVAAARRRTAPRAVKQQ
jgi:branched-chain amino acid transport system permease protein